MQSRLLRMKTIGGTSWQWRMYVRFYCFILLLILAALPSSGKRRKAADINKHKKTIDLKGYGIRGGYRGYGGYSLGGYRGYYGKREAEAEPYYGYGGYGGYGGYRGYGGYSL